MSYRPTVSSSTAGAFALAVIRDPGAAGGTGNTFSNVASCAGAVTSSVWQPFTIDATREGLVDPAWKYVETTNSAANNSEQREDGCCTLSVGGGSTSGLSAATNYGYFILSGLLEFKQIIGDESLI